MRVGIVSTHPIQYHAPWFRALARREDLDLTVLFCHMPSAQAQGDAGFGVAFEWDSDLLGGYHWEMLSNVSPRPDVSSFGGLVCSGVSEALDSGNFDAIVILGWYYAAAWQFLIEAARRGLPAFLRGDSNLKTETSALRRAIRSAVYRNAFRLAAGGMPVGTLSRDYFREMGIPEHRIHIVPYCVDKQYFELRERELLPNRGSLRRAFGLPEGGVVFLFAGKLLPGKRPLDFIEAVAIASEGGAPVSALVVGDGPLRKECEELARARKAPVRFAGFLNQSRMPEAYIASDVLVLPSDGETWGLVVNEAMQFGLPCIVSSKVGSGPDLVSLPGAGTVFDGGLEGLVRSIRETALNREELDRQKRNTRHVSEACRPDRVAAETVRALAGVVREGHGTREADA